MGSGTNGAKDVPRYFGSLGGEVGHGTSEIAPPAPMPADGEAFLAFELSAEAMGRPLLDSIMVTVAHIDERASAGTIRIRVDE